MERSRSSVVRDELLRAVKEGRPQDVQVLVDQGADIHACFDRFPHGTVMHLAAFYGHRDLLAFFLTKGLDVNAIDTEYHHTPLHLASAGGRAKAVQFLLEQHGNIHAVNKFGQKPIYMATEFGQKDVVEIFLTKGMDIQEAYGEGLTLLHLSCMRGKLEVVQLLVSYKADIHATDADGRKPIHVAVVLDQKDIVKYFLDVGMSIEERDQNGRTALHLAAQADRLNVVQLLVDRIGAKPQLDVQDNEGKTPMHMCYRNSDILNCLLDAGARSDIKDHDGRTVLFYVMNGRLNFGYLQSVLARMHPNFVDIDDKTKMTAAHLLVKCPRNMDLIKLVLQIQGDSNIEDKDGETPMNYLTKDLASSDETLIRMLVDHGAYFKAVDCERIVQDRSLKDTLFTDKKFCSQCLVNKFDNVDLPMLGKLASAIPLSVLDRLKLKSGQICQIEMAVEEEIRNKGHCDVSKMAPPLLIMLAIESYISHCRTTLRNLYFVFYSKVLN